MRLLRRDKSGWFGRILTFSLTTWYPPNIPSYAILSRRWGEEGEEVTFEDIEQGTARTKKGYKKLEFCADQADRDGLIYFWVDTCCIKKASDAEMSEAINSMFKWYQNATRCYVYLPDVPAGPGWEAAFEQSEWFTRGWTLQELLVPAIVEFFSKDGQKLGDKKSRESQIHQITGIPLEALRGKPLSEIDEEERFSWTSKRQTTIEEDAVYCLLGIFNIYMPLIYGEGQQKALIRLRREIRLSSVHNAFVSPAVRSQQALSAGTSLAISASSATLDETGSDTDADILSHNNLRLTGWTILHAAVNNQNFDGVSATLALGYDPNAQTTRGWTPLWVAAIHGSLEISRLLLEAGANINLTDGKGTTALREAAQFGATELVQLLVDYGADVNLAPYDIQAGPLIAASAKNHTDVVRILLEAGANPRAQQFGGWSPLHYALLNKNETMTTLVLSYGPDVNAYTKNGVCPLHLAAMAGLTDICKQLLDLGAEIEASQGGLTPLMLAVQAGSLSTVELLVRQGSKTDVVHPKDGYSLVERALILGHVDVYQYLLSSNLDRTLQF